MQTRPRPKRLRKFNRKAKPVREGKPGLKLEPYQIILRPLVTRKIWRQSAAPFLAMMRDSSIKGVGRAELKKLIAGNSVSEGAA